MDPMKDCLAKLQAIMDELNKLTSDEAAETTDEGKAAKRLLYAAKNAEYEKEHTRYQTLKTNAKRQADLVADRALLGTVAPGVIPAQAKTHEDGDMELVDAFKKYCIGETLSGNEREALRPKSEVWGKAGQSGARDGIRIPGILGKMARGVKGKALPMTSGTQTASSLVWADYLSELEKFDPEETVLWDRVRKIPTTHGEVILPAVDQDTNTDDYAGASFGWTAEGAAAPGQEPKFKQLDFPMFEAKAKTELANRLLRRSTINIEAFVTWLFSTVLANGAETAVIAGTGVGQPKGIAYAGNFKSIARVAGNNLANYDDCVKVLFGVQPKFRKKGIWVVADDLMAILMALKDTTGRPIFTMSLRDGEPDTLLGRPIFPTTRKSLGAAADLSFGDPTRYIAPVEQETVIAKSEHQKFDQGVTVFLAFMAMGGNVSTNRAWAGLAANT